MTPESWCSTPGPATAVTSMPIFCATLFDLVFLQNAGPMPVRLKEYFRDLADCSAASHGRGDVMRRALDFRPGIGSRDRKSYSPHDDDVGQIVARISHFRHRDAALFLNLFKNRNLLDMALINVGHLYLSRSLFGGRRDSTADDASLDPVPGKPLQCDA